MASPVNSFMDMAKSLRDTLLRAIKAGLDEKKRVYVPGAKACNEFYLGNYKHLFKEKTMAAVDNNFLTVNTEVANKPMRLPMFQMADNVVAQFVQVYSPYLTQGEMTRTVTATKPYSPPPSAYGIDPPQLQQMQMSNPDKNQVQMYAQTQQQAVQQFQIDQMIMMKDGELRLCRAQMLEILLNYFAKELNLREERKRVVDESLIVGAGVFITELVSMPLSNNQLLIASNWVSMNDIVWDPDCVRTKDAKWLAIQYRAPAWMVSRLFNVPETDLKPNTRSSVGQNMSDYVNVPPHRKTDISNDEVVFWKVWSRVGCGARLQPLNSRNKMLSDYDNQIGDYAWFVVTDCCDYPLNFGPTVYQQATMVDEQNKQAMAQHDQATAQYQQYGKMALMAGMVPPPPPQPPQIQDPWEIIKTACLWPIEFFLDIDDPWPVTVLEYHTRPGSPYPVPHLEFCLSYMNFMVWVICFIADKCYRSNRTIWLIDESISQQLQDAIIKGEDEAIVKMRDVSEAAIKEFIQFVDAPEIKKEIFDVYAFFQEKFERASGLTDLMQAKMARATRSATEAKVISDASTLRPESMADQVYHIDTRVARKEAIAAMRLLQGSDIASIMGDPAGRAWDQLVINRDIITLLRESQYDVVASPGRVLDLNTRQNQAQSMAQIVLPLLTQIGQVTGQFGPANAVLTEYAKANQIDPALVQLPPIIPPVQGGSPKGQASPPKQTQNDDS